MILGQTYTRAYQSLTLPTFQAGNQGSGRRAPTSAVGPRSRNGAKGWGRQSAQGPRRTDLAGLWCFLTKLRRMDVAGVICNALATLAPGDAGRMALNFRKRQSVRLT